MFLKNNYRGSHVIQEAGNPNKQKIKELSFDAVQSQTMLFRMSVNNLSCTGKESRMLFFFKHCSIIS